MTNSMIGKKFGRLTVIKRQSTSWLCRCDCGNTKNVITAKLNNGHTKSCGCFRKDKTSSSFKNHGATGTLTYKRWKSMQSRCHSVNSKSYQNYGGRGIKVCEQWLYSFDNFLKDMGECPSAEYTLERINNQGNYEPLNCKWATKKEQNRNTSRNRLIQYKGETHCIGEWAEILGISKNTIYKRLYRGLSIDEALKP